MPVVMYGKSFKTCREAIEECLCIYCPFYDDCPRYDDEHMVSDDSEI